MMRLSGQLRSARCAALLLLAGAAASSHAQLRVVAWNISHWDGTDRIADVQTAVYGSFSGRSMSPDVIIAQEFSNAASLTTFVNALNTASGSPGDWAAAPFVTGPDSQGVCVYRTSKATLVGNQTWTIALGDGGSTTDQPRHTYRYDIRPVGYNAAGTTISMYNVHLKSGSASADNARRLIETQRIRDNAEGVNTNGAGTGKPAAYQFLVAGDMNVQSSTQTAYAELVGSQTNNTGRFFDPINTPGSWNNNGAFDIVHTQDPSGAGGMDDRHDQILVSAGLVDGLGLDYIGNSTIAYSTTTWNDPNHSYRVWGNDGTSYNLGLTTTGNTMVGPAIAQALKNCATTAGGHLPVFLDIKVPGKITAPAAINFGTVALGSTAQITVNVGNGGDVAKWTAAGIANVTYTLAASSGFTAPAGSQNDAAGGALNSHTITMNTSTAGVKSGTLTIASNDVDTPSLVIPITGTVQATNTPPIANAGADQTLTDVNGSGNEPVTLNGAASIDSDGTIVLYRWTEGATQLASGTAATANVTLAVGVHDIQLTVTDNANATASDTVRITVNPRPNTPPTANAGSDQTVTDVDGSGTEPVTLNGSGSSDSDGTITSYVWKEGATTIATGVSPSVALSVGVHTLSLTVTDNSRATATDTVIVTVNPRPNTPPTASAGSDLAVVDGDRSGSEDVQLDGSASSDSDGTIVSYEWKEGGTTIATGITPLVPFTLGTHTVQLIVTDNNNATSSDTLIVTVTTPCIADFNQDGGVDGADVESFFFAWEAGGC